MYLGIDCETGGIGLDKTLLSVGLAIYNEKFEAVADMELLVKPDDGIYHIDPLSIEIHKIDLLEHCKRARIYKATKTPLFNWLASYKNENNERLIIVGKGVSGDLAHINKYLLNQDSINQICNYSKIDIDAVWMTIKALGKIPLELGDSLEDMCKFMLIDYTNGHTALGDAHLHVECFQRMMEMLK